MIARMAHSLHIALAVLAGFWILGGSANATSVITLVVFGLVNLALLRLQARAPLPAGVRGAPRAVPVLGFLACAAALAWELARRLT